MRTLILNASPKLLLMFSHSVMFNSFATANHQAPLSMGFPNQEYWSGLPFPSTGDFPEPGVKFTSPTLARGFFTTESPGKPRP